MTLIACQNSPKKMTYNNFDIQGHRGARSVRPENTIPAFDYALQVGVTTLELDTVVTKDNVVVVHHNLTMNRDLCRIANGQKPKKNIYIRNLNLQQVKSYDCGSIANPRFPKQVLQPGTKIPTLEEVFKFVKNSKHPSAKTVLFNIETKSDPSKPKAQPQPETFVKLILDLAQEQQLLHRITIQSFDHRTLIAAHKLQPKVTRAALFEKRPKDILKATQEAKSSIFSPYHKWLTKKDVQLLQKNGIKVIPWTANDETVWKKLIHLQVDGIITDDPGALINYITRHDDQKVY